LQAGSINDSVFDSMMMSHSRVFEASDAKQDITGAFRATVCLCLPKHSDSNYEL
jgi:hypothetical protein